MAFSEVIGQDNNWINNQIEKSLQESTHAELTDLKKLVLDSSKNVKLEKTDDTKIDLKKEHIVSVLNQNKNKSRHDIYETGKGAGVTFAVQYALNEMGYAPGTIDGVLGAKTKAAVKKFQEEWNKKNPLLKITEDGLAGGKTLEKMSFAMQNIYLWKATSPQQSQTPETPEAQQTPETETPEVQQSSDNIFDPLFKDNGLTIEQIKNKIIEWGGIKGISVAKKNGGDIYFVLKDPSNDDHIVRYIYNYNPEAPEKPSIQRKDLLNFSDGPKVTTLDDEDLRDVRNTDVSTYQKLADKYNQLYKTKGGSRETKKEVYGAIWYNLGDAVGDKDACSLVERATNDPIGKQFRTRGKNQKALGNKNTTLKDFLIYLQP